MILRVWRGSRGSPLGTGQSGLVSIRGRRRWRLL